MAATVIYTETFNHTLEDRIDHFSQWSDTNSVIDKIEALIEKFEDNVKDNPLMYPPCQELTGIGVYDIHQFSFNGFKLLYEFDETTNTVIGLVLISDHQDLQSTLIDYCIMHR